MPDIFVAPSEKEPEEKPKKKAGTVEEKLAKEFDKQKRNPLASFAVRPKVKFETQEKKEKVILLLRRHPITNLHWILKATGMFLVPILVSQIFPLEAAPPDYLLIGAIFWYLLSFAYAFEQFLSWLFNVNIITDERVVDVDFPSILYKDITVTKIDQVQDVNIKTGGYIRSLFNFGDVVIQTAGAIPEICFEAIPNPGRVVVVLNDLMLEEERERIEGRVR